MRDDRERDRVSLDPLDPVTALRALLAVHPEPESPTHHPTDEPESAAHESGDSREG